ncbi:hypothetical protein [Nitrosospira sp. Nsp11]|uniref:hypothetical protein n=1 Tax=Nitrosospira sp. Nsp11 TaxID=1855338 RepID=UPI00093234DD|nr:hypothetical protein [Nitrosospira sp. Nsp11]
MKVSADNRLWVPSGEAKQDKCGIWWAVIALDDEKEETIDCGTIYGGTKVEAEQRRSEIIAAHNRLVGARSAGWKVVSSSQIPEIKMAAVAIETRGGEDVCLVVHENIGLAVKVAMQIVSEHNAAASTA